MNYLKGIIKAVIPRRPHEIATVAVMASIMVWVGYQVMLQSPPTVTVFSETQYPKSVPQGGYFYLNIDVSFDQSCSIAAKRYVVASDGVEYLAQEDNKDVIAGDRMQYVVRVPVGETLPVGPALVRSHFTYECGFWSRWVRAIERTGQARRILITEAGSLPTMEVVPRLPPKDGYVIIKSYYRKKPSS